MSTRSSHARPFVGLALLASGYLLAACDDHLDLGDAGSSAGAGGKAGSSGRAGGTAGTAGGSGSAGTSGGGAAGKGGGAAGKGGGAGSKGGGAAGKGGAQVAGAGGGSGATAGNGDAGAGGDAGSGAGGAGAGGADAGGAGASAGTGGSAGVGGGAGAPGGGAGAGGMAGASGAGVAGASSAGAGGGGPVVCGPLPADATKLDMNAAINGADGLTGPVQGGVFFQVEDVGDIRRYDFASKVTKPVGGPADGVLVMHGENLLYRRPAPVPTEPQISWGTGDGTLGSPMPEPYGVGSWLAVRADDAIRVVYASLPKDGEAKLERFVASTKQLTTIAVVNNEAKNFVGFGVEEVGGGRFQRGQTTSTVLGIHTKIGPPHESTLYVVPFDGSPARDLVVLDRTTSLDVLTTHGERVFLWAVDFEVDFSIPHLVMVDLANGGAVTDFGEFPEAQGGSNGSPLGGWAYANDQMLRFATLKGKTPIRVYRIDLQTKLVTLERCITGDFGSVRFMGHPGTGIFARLPLVTNPNAPWIQVGDPLP